MRSPVAILALLAVLAAPAAARANDNPFLEYGLYRPLAAIGSVVGLAGAVAFSPFAFVEGSVRGIRGTPGDRGVGTSLGEGSTNLGTEGARSVTRGISQAAWCPATYAATGTCREIAWARTAAERAQTGPLAE